MTDTKTDCHQNTHRICILKKETNIEHSRNIWILPGITVSQKYSPY